MSEIVQGGRRFKIRCLGISVSSSESRTDQVTENVDEFAKVACHTLGVLQVTGVTHRSNGLEHRVFCEIQSVKEATSFLGVHHRAFL